MLPGKVSRLWYREKEPKSHPAIPEFGDRIKSWWRARWLKLSEQCSRENTPQKERLPVYLWLPRGR